MDIKTLKGAIYSSTIPNLLIFNAIEPALASQYLDKISDTLSLRKSVYDSADGVIYDIQTNLKEDRLYIITEDLEILKNPKYMENLLKCDKHIIVEFFGIDSKYNKFLKDFDKYIVTFDKLDELSLLRYAEKRCADKGITVEQSKLKALVQYSDNNLGCLLNELDKIFTLGQTNSNILVEYMLKNGFSDYRKTDSDKLIYKIVNCDSDTYEYYIRAEGGDDGVAMLMYKVYSEARRLFVSTHDPKYAIVLKLSAEIYNGIMDGSIAEEYAFKYYVLRLSDEISNLRR